MEHSSKYERYLQNFSTKVKTSASSFLLETSMKFHRASLNVFSDTSFKTYHDIHFPLDNSKCSKNLDKNKQFTRSTCLSEQISIT